MSDSLRPYELLHTRLPCPLLSSRVCSNSCPFELVMPSNHLILYHLLLLWPLIFPIIGVFSSESTLCIRWLKYWSFSISPSNEYSVLVIFRIDWFDLLAVQGTLKSLLQHHNLKASILWHLAFFMVQISHPYMTTRKTIVLAIWTFVSQVTSLLFNMLSLSFPSKEQASFNFMAAVTVCSDFRAPQNKICHGFRFSPFIYHEVMGLDAMILVF